MSEERDASTRSERRAFSWGLVAAIIGLPIAGAGWLFAFLPASLVGSLLFAGGTVSAVLSLLHGAGRFGRR
jgi:hypothetical protein